MEEARIKADRSVSGKHLQRLIIMETKEVVPDFVQVKVNREYEENCWVISIRFGGWVFKRRVFYDNSEWTSEVDDYHKELYDIHKNIKSGFSDLLDKDTRLIWDMLSGKPLDYEIFHMEKDRKVYLKTGEPIEYGRDWVKYDPIKRYPLEYYPMRNVSIYAGVIEESKQIVISVVTNE